ncbi:MAG: hypothetical protein LBK06_02440, partial [Planctomycetaceae bacterium]|nr:hypothetical protein [Planctomycetaceae bacterium]
YNIRRIRKPNIRHLRNNKLPTKKTKNNQHPKNQTNPIKNNIFHNIHNILHLCIKIHTENPHEKIHKTKHAFTTSQNIVQGQSLSLYRLRYSN